MSKNPFTEARRFKKNRKQKDDKIYEGTSLADKFGTEDHTIFNLAIEDGTMAMDVKKPEDMSWQEFIAVIKFVIASGLSKSSGVPVSEVLLFLEGIIDAERPEGGTDEEELEAERTSAMEQELTPAEKEQLLEMYKKERLAKLAEEDE